MDYKYVRIQGQEQARNTIYAKGIFSMYQVCVKVPGVLTIEEVQENWSPQDS